MKVWVHNGRNEIRKIKARNFIPAAKKATFIKGWSEKVKEWTIGSARFCRHPSKFPGKLVMTRFSILQRSKNC